jgi:hypothetical protein
VHLVEILVMVDQIIINHLKIPIADKNIYIATTVFTVKVAIERKKLVVLVCVQDVYML